MADDDRFCAVNGNVIKLLRTKQRSWSRKRLADTADVSIDTIKRAEKGESLQLRNVQKLATALGVEPRELSGETGRLGGSMAVAYDWEIATVAAEKVCFEIFGQPPRCNVRLLTFPGPSLVFAGLVLANLPVELAIRIPVYTCIFVDESGPEPPGFHPVVTEPDDPTTAFKVLVPEALTTQVGDATIVALDDTIISGLTMKALRKYFRRRGCSGVAFACGVCYEGRTVRGEVAPEIIGIEAPSPKFRLPWGAGFCFEAVMRNKGS